MDRPQEEAHGEINIYVYILAHKRKNEAHNLLLLRNLTFLARHNSQPAEAGLALTLPLKLP